MQIKVRPAVRLLKTDLCGYYDGWERAGPAPRVVEDRQTGQATTLRVSEEGVIWFYFAQYHILRHNLRRIPTNPRARPEPATPEHAQPPRPDRLDVVNAESALQKLLARPHRLERLCIITRA